MNYLYCNRCNNLFFPEYAKEMCPIAGCDNSLVEIDELIAYQVQELNRLGYYTDCCCSGHIRDIKAGYCGAYILFTNYEETIEDVVKKYLEHIEYKPFVSGLDGEKRWDFRFREDYVNKCVGIPPEHLLITEFIDCLNQLIRHLKVGQDVRRITTRYR